MADASFALEQMLEIYRARDIGAARTFYFAQLDIAETIGELPCDFDDTFLFLANAAEQFAENGNPQKALEMAIPDKKTPIYKFFQEAILDNVC